MEHPSLIDLVRYAKREKQFYKVQMISNLYLWGEDTVRSTTRGSMTCRSASTA